ncbi:MAG: hypothetical protein M3N93_12165 [Acidobacteriota bacterium]|nr:hypothetical protein [Acidobacteriota bacterium]
MEQKFHLTDDQLESYVLGRLPSADVSILEEHLIVCAACQEELDRATDFTIGVREALEADPLLAAEAAGERSPPTAGWLNRVRRPAFSMTLGFVALIIAIGIFSNGRTKFAPSASLQLTAMRGEMPSTVPARQFELTLSDAPKEGGPFRIDVVNEVGVSMWRGLAPASADGVHVNVQQKLASGDYFVRIYSPEGQVLREYGFRVHA